MNANADLIVIKSRDLRLTNSRDRLGQRIIISSLFIFSRRNLIDIPIDQCWSYLTGTHSEHLLLHYICDANRALPVIRYDRVIALLTQAPREMRSGLSNQYRRMRNICFATSYGETKKMETLFSPKVSITRLN